MRILAFLLLFPGLALAQTATDPAIGRVNVGGFSRLRLCTGTLVGPATVLTAAHCVSFADGRPRGAMGMGFVAGWERGMHLGAASVEEIVLHPEAVADGAIDRAHDIAVLRLDRRIAQPPRAVGRAGVAGAFTLVGYPRDVPHLQRVETDCAGRARGPYWLLSCAVSPGMSGGPVFSGAGDALRLVGVISAIAGDEALAIPVDDWVMREVARPYTP